MPNTTINIITKYKGKAFDDLKKDSEKLKKELAGIGRDLAGGLALGAVIAGLGMFVKGSFEAADQARVTESAFINLSDGAAQARENLMAMSRATRDLISETEQQAIANQLLGMQIVSTDEELEKVVGVSRRLGKEFRGLGAEEAANEFAIMMSNMSVQRLDSFGISSGKVRERINELLASTEGMTREAAFFQATMEQAEQTLTRLGPEIETNADQMARLQAETANFQGSFGEMVQAFGDASGIVEGLTSLMEGLTEGAESWTFVIEQAKLLNQALNETKKTGNEAADSLVGFADKMDNLQLITSPTAFVMDLLAEKTGQLIAPTDELKEKYNELAQEAEAVNKATADATQNTEDNTDAVNDNAEALEEAAKRMEKVSEIRQDFARSLIEIDDQAQEDTKSAWGDFFDDNRSGWADHLETVANLKKRSAEAIVKIDDDLQKDLEKNAKKLQKDLAKVNKDENKQIEEIKRKAATDDRNDDKRRKIDVLADERLFNFELKQLAAEGNANAIKEALERREIEEQIAKEKAQVEQQIEDTKLQDDIRRVRDAAQERRSELQTEAAERASILRTEAEETKALREEQLQEELEAEREKLREEVVARREALDEKLKLIEEGKNEAISKLAEELTETGDLTRSELGKLVPVAGEFGDAAGTAFAEGLNKGFEENERISGLLGEAADFRTPNRAGAGGSRGITGNPGMLGFQHGGSFTVGGSGGPDSQLVQFMATPGERVDVSPQGRGGGGLPPITINANGVGADQLAAILERKVNEGLQEYTDTVLQPVLEGV